MEGAAEGADGSAVGAGVVLNTCGATVKPGLGAWVARPCFGSGLGVVFALGVPVGLGVAVRITSARRSSSLLPTGEGLSPPFRENSTAAVMPITARQAKAERTSPFLLKKTAVRSEKVRILHLRSDRLSIFPFSILSLSVRFRALARFDRI